jgi:hypothetical protein
LLPESGTTVAQRFPITGDIIRYRFLFEHEAASKNPVPAYARPCFVVSSDPARRLVTVAAITTKGDRYPGTFKLPGSTARAVGMSDPTNSSVVVTQLCRFEWIGFDIEMIMGKGTPHYGTASPGLTKAILDAIPSDTLRRWRGLGTSPPLFGVEAIPAEPGPVKE